MTFEMYNNYFHLVRAFCVILFWLGLGLGLIDVAFAACT